MSNESLASWTTDTAILVLDRLPLQTLASCTTLVTEYIGTTGGWIPDDPGQPLGPGQPASGQSQPEAADTIAEGQLERVYRTSVTADIKVNYSVIQNLDPGLSDNDVLVLIEESLADFLESQLDCTILKITEEPTFTGEVLRNGATTTEQRQEADTQIKSGEKLTTPLSIGLNYARQRFDLDDLWNATYIYTETNNDTVVLVEKYTTVTYDIVDNSSIDQHVVTMDSTTYKLASGLTKQRDQE